MKHFFPTFVTALLASVVAPGLVAQNTPTETTTRVDMTVVAQQTEDGSRAGPSGNTSGHTAAVFDGGYIEAGDPIAGEKPPTDVAVSQAVRDALSKQGVTATATGATPDLLIVYHWGLIRHSSAEYQRVSQLDPLFRARLYLVSPPRVASRIERDLIAHQSLGWTADLQQALELTHGPRYFAIVSAYDFAALARDEKTLLWRTRVSSRATGPSMNQTIPSLIFDGAPYFGRNLDSAEQVPAPILRWPAPSASAFPTAPQNPTDATHRTIRQIIDQEHLDFSGGPLRSNG